MVRNVEDAVQGAQSRRPKVLVAGTRHAIDVLTTALGNEFDVAGSTTIPDAIARLPQVDLVMCNVQFDDSRMFEFLHEMRERHGGRNIPVICCRVHAAPLSPTVRRAIEHALEALGIVVFVDRPLMLERYSPAVVDEMLRQLVIDRLPVPRTGAR